ncbi:MAG: LON peptidase substrate-binding domain-containing protein [Gemmatimonadota bacterium]
MRLPIFPIPVVLLPGAMMPLHIFEERYQRMVLDVLEGDQRFGMIYHDWDDHGPFLSEPGTIGCVATIREHQPLEDGRSLLAVAGGPRFRIVEDLDQVELYFEAVVEPVADTTIMEGDELIFRRRESIRLFHQLVDTLAADSVQLPTINETEEVSYMLAQTIQMKPKWHQRLLELTDEGSRLERVDQVLRRALGE